LTHLRATHTGTAVSRPKWLPGAARRPRAAGCAASAPPAFSKPRAARRASAPRSASRPTAASRWCLIRRFPYRSGLGVTLGTQSNGQGHETSFAQIAADLRAGAAMPVAALDGARVGLDEAERRDRQAEAIALGAFRARADRCAASARPFANTICVAWWSAAPPICIPAAGRSGRGRVRRRALHRR
jgi:hypothetical protein